MLVSCLAWLLAQAGAVSAATRTWTGAAPDAFWTNAANWSPAGAPVNGDTLVFAGGVPQTISTNRGGALTSLAALNFTGTNFSLLSQNPLTLTGGLTHNPPGNVTNFCRLGLALGADQTWSIGNGVFLVQSNVAIGSRTLSIEDSSAAMEFRVGPSGSGSITKIGAGTLAFLAPTPFTGTLTTHGGLVLVNDDFAGTIVADTAAMVGTTNSTSSADGLILNFGGTLSPGLTGRNIFTSSNSVFFQQGATLRVDLSAGTTPGFGHDQLVVFGGVTLNGATLDLQTTGTASGGAAYRIIDNDGVDPVSSIFRSLPEGRFLTNNAQAFQITYRGGDGNDVVLRKVPIVPAAVRHWTGGGVGGAWSTPGNWSNNVAPGFGDILIFPAGASKVIVTNDFADERAFGGLRFFGTNYQIHGNRFALGGTGLLFTNASGTNTIFADVTLVGAQTWDIPGSSRTLQVFGEILGSVDADLFKGGAGTLVLTNNPVWLGSLTSSNGPVVFNGDNGRVSVNAGGTIRGLGPVGPLTATNASAILEPGTGRLRVNGDLALGGGANFAVTLSGAIEGFNYGTISVTGAVEIAGADLFVTTTFNPSLGTEFILIRNDGTDPVSGAGFVGRPEGAIFTAGARSFAISYHGGDGNDVTITAVTAPTGVTRVWDGGGGANDSWTNRLNWDSDIAVLPGDSLVFTRSTPDGARNDFPAGTAFGAISFTAQNGFSSFSLTGNPFGLLSGLTSSVPGTAQIFNDLEFLAAQTIGGEGTGPLNLFGALSGDVGAVLTLDRRGGASFGGGTANTYRGQIQVRRGSLSLVKADAVTAIRGPLVIGGSGVSASVRVASSSQFADSPPVRLLDSGATLSVQDPGTNSIGVLTVSGGTVDLGESRFNTMGFLATNDARLRLDAGLGFSGLMNVTGSVVLAGCTLTIDTGASVLDPGRVLRLIENDGVDPVIGEFLNAPSGLRFTNGIHVLSISYAAGPGNNDVVVQVVGFAPPHIRVWSGAGTDALWSNRTNWQGDVAPVRGDALVFPADAARTVSTNDYLPGTAFFSLEFGNTNHSVHGSGIQLLGGIQAPDAAPGSTIAGVFCPLDLWNAQTFFGGFPTLRFLNGVNLSGRLLTLDGSTPKQFFGPISGTGRMEIRGNTVLFGDNTFEGRVQVVSGGVLEIDSDLALGSPLANTTIDLGARLNFGPHPITCAEPLFLAGSLAALGRSNVLTGVIQLPAGVVEVQQGAAVEGSIDVNGPVSGPGGWKVFDRMTLTLRGPNTYTGATIVFGGVVEVNGSQPASTVQVQRGLLRGDGRIGPLSVISGGVHPGEASRPGRLTVDGNASLSSAVRMTFNLNGPAPGTEYDQLAVNGAVELDGALLDVNLSAGFGPQLGASFTLVDNDGTDPVVGTFNGLDEGAILSVGLALFRITYHGGTGNDVVLTNLTIFPTGDTATWTGNGVNDNWTLPANWLNQVKPVNGDDIAFLSNVPAAQRPNSNNFAGLFVNRLYLDGPGWNLTGNPLRLMRGLFVTNRSAGPVPVLNLPIELVENQPWTVISNSLVVRSSIQLGTSTLVLVPSFGDIEIPANIHGAGLVVKRGGGGLVFSGTNDFTGGMQIEGGTVTLRRDHVAGPPWRLFGGRLELAAGLPGLDAVGGTVAPDGDVGDLTIAGDLHLGSGVVLDLGNSLSRLRVHGTVSLNGALLANVPLTFGLESVGAREIVLIENDGTDPVDGTFTGLPEGALLPTGVPGFTNRVSYMGGDGNDVTVSWAPVPATHLTRIWDGGGTNASWQTGSNWVADFLPEPGDDLLFPAAAARKTNHLNTAGAINLVLANSLQFDGAGYVITNQSSGLPFDFNIGVLQLTEGIRSLQASGTNMLRLPLALAGDQDWNVASSNATLRLSGFLLGQAAARKTGLGLLEITNVTATNGTRFVNASGPAVLRDATFESVVVSGGRLDIAGGGALHLQATGGVTRLANAFIGDLRVDSAEVQVVATPLNLGQGYAATNITLSPASRLVLDFPTSNATAFLVHGPVTIADATLDVRVTCPIRPGERLAIFGPFPGQIIPFPPIFGSPTNAFPTSVTGTFEGLPDGAVTNYSGRPYRINYTVDLGPLGTFPGVLLTALVVEPQFTNITRLVNGQVRLQGLAETAANVIFEATEDFIQYTVVGNVLSTAAGQFQFTDTSASAITRRYYRARYP